MKKLLLLFVALLFTSMTINAATGWFSDYIKLDVSGAGTAGPTGWYWIGGDPGYATQLDGANLGPVTSLVITGCDMRYWSDTQDRTGGSFFYQITSSDGSTVIVGPTETIWNQSFLGGNNYQGTKSVSINLFAGLSPSTTYKLQIWAKHWGTGQGDNYLSNGGANYVATFTTPAAPTAYNVTGSGSYCQGGAGLPVGVANSEAGVTYTISVGGATVAGTGSAISFGIRTAGTYTVSGSNTVGTTAMTGSVVITETAGLSSVTITPNDAQAFCGTATGTELTATETGGGAITTRQWGKRSETGGTITPISGATSQTYTPSGADLGVGIWYVVCTSTPTCGSLTVSDEVTVTVNAIPSIPIITHTTPLTFCTGGSVVLTASAAESFLWSTEETTSAITVSTSGSYTVKVTTSGCQSVASLPTVVTVNPYPSAAGTITGNSTVTQGDAGVAYSVPAITDATTYFWHYTGTGATITGTSDNVTIAFSLSATSGNLTVKGNNSCGDGAFSAIFPITVNTLTTPFTFNVTGGGTYCSSALGSVGLDGSQIGVNYQLYKNSVIDGSPVPGTGDPIDFGLKTAGTYTVKGDNGYTVNMTGNAVIIVDIAPTGTAGSDDNAVVGVPYLLSGSSATNYTSLGWTIVSGTGSITGSSLLHPTYTANIDDETATLKLTVKNGVCDDVIDEVTLTMIPAVGGKIWIGNTSNWEVADNWLSLDGKIPSITDDVVISGGVNKPTITTSAVCNNMDISYGTLTIASGGSLTVAGTLTNTIGNTGLVVKSGGSLKESTAGVAATVERTISTAATWHYISAVNSNTLSGKFTGDFLQSWDESTESWSYITGTNATLNPVQGYSLWVKTGGAPKTYSFTGAVNTGNQSQSISFTPGSIHGNDGANFLGNPYPSSLDWAGLQGTYGAVYYWNGTAYVSYINGNGGGSQFVPPMQGFFIVTDADGTFALTNDNRVHSSTPFYKSGSEIMPHTLVLATQGESYSDKLFVNFNPAATEGFDLQNDAYKFVAYTPGISELYTYTGDKKLSVDVRPEAQVIPLGFMNTLSGEYQIGIDKIADIPVVYLEDTKVGTFHDLLTGPYKFSYTAGESDKRFMLLFGTTGLKETRKNAATVYSYQKTVYINMADQALGDIFIYNIAGQQVASKLAAQGMNEIKLTNTGNYIVKVISKNSTVVRKVFILQ